MMLRLFWAGLAGLIFAIGLAFSGMLHPAKVQGFLNIAGLVNGISWSGAKGYWDPSLALVMIGALMVTFFTLGGRMPSPELETDGQASGGPVSDGGSGVDIRLIAGAALFGVGWALAGYCPGPALASVSSGSDAFTFCAAMLAAMWLTKRILSRGQPNLEAADSESAR